MAEQEMLPVDPDREAIIHLSMPRDFERRYNLSSVTVEQVDRDAAIEFATVYLYPNSSGVRRALTESFARHRLAATKAADERVRLMEERAAFLLDRLAEIEWHDDGYETVQRDYFGHVEPAIEGLRAALAEAGGRGG